MRNRYSRCFLQGGNESRDEFSTDSESHHNEARHCEMQRSNSIKMSINKLRLGKINEKLLRVERNVRSRPDEAEAGHDAQGAEQCNHSRLHPLITEIAPNWRHDRVDPALDHEHRAHDDRLKRKLQFETH